MYQPFFYCSKSFIPALYVLRHTSTPTDIPVALRRNVPEQYFYQQQKLLFKYLVFKYMDSSVRWKSIVLSYGMTFSVLRVSVFFALNIRLLIGSLKRKQDRYPFPVSLYCRSKMPASQYFFIFLAILRVLFRYSVGSSCSTYGMCQYS